MYCSMESLAGYGGNSALGFNNNGLSPVIGNRFRRESDNNGDEIITNLSDEEAKFASMGRQFLAMSEHSLEEYRGDTLNDISSGLNMVASGIKMITTILSLFGADTVDR